MFSPVASIIDSRPVPRRSGKVTKGIFLLSFILFFWAGKPVSAVSPNLDIGGEHPQRAHLLHVLHASSAEQPDLILGLLSFEDPAIAPVLEAWRRGELFTFRETEESDSRIILLDFATRKDGKHPAVWVDSGEPVVDSSDQPRLFDPGSMSFLRTNSRVRRSIGRIVEIAAINDLDRRTRTAAIERLGNSRNPEFLKYLRQRSDIEEDHRVLNTLAVAISILELQSDDPDVKLAAIERLTSSRSLMAKSQLETIVQQYEGQKETGEPGDITSEMAAAAAFGISRIDTHWKIVNSIANFFRGLSLGSVLLMMALGLAITFGLMGVINMAHGELMVVGAYATFLTQNLFIGWFGLDGAGFNAYFLMALPVAFLAAASVGLIIERTVIRFLYNRPLESLLATWGIALVLQQIFRMTFGPSNVQINAPSYLTGNFVVFDIVFAYNRVFVIGFAALVVFLVWYLLTRTSMGLNIRAVMQNPSMASCMGVRNRRVNMLTFAFGSGLAGLAGACLTQLTNVGPFLGQNHIVDSFMVVVAGGVGNIFGTVIAALMIGTVDQLLQPVLGAVMGKIVVLFAIILFLQRRPGGLFPTRSRALD